MRSLRLAAILLFVVSSSLLADGLPKQQMSVFITPQSVAYSQSRGTDFTGGAGIAVNLWWTHRLSTEFAVSIEQSYSRSSVTRPDPGGPVTIVESVRAQTYPFDAIAQYHFVNESRWQPYAGLGVRYVRAPHLRSRAEVTGDQTSAEISGGVVWQFSPRWGVKLDGKQLLRNDDAFYDSSSKGSIGIIWKF